MSIEKIKKKYNDILIDFDKVPKDTIYQRRASFNILWDFFQKLILDVGVELCGLYRESMKISHLNTRWNKAKLPLSYIENPPDNLNNLVNRVHKLRGGIQHSKENQEFAPNSNELDDIRKKCPEFLDWILDVGIKFYRSSKNFTLPDYFSRIISYYMGEIDIILSNYGTKKIPYVANYVYLPFVIDSSYKKIIDFKEKYEKKRFQIHNLEDIDQSDLESLVDLIEIVSKIKAWEDALLKENICPKCGEKIITTNTPFGGTPDDPEPDGIYHRVGCEKCDYYIDSDTI